MPDKQNRIPLIIDTDPGVDDAAALFWVLANPRFNVLALTIANGNVGLEQCAQNALKILEAAGRTDIPVYVGAALPLLRRPVDAAWVHGADGLGDAGLPPAAAQPAPGFAPAEMARIACASEAPVTILALAPLTNVALALRLCDEMKQHVDKVLFMGGAVRVPGNESPAASFNVAIDPEAAKIVYNSGLAVVQLGLDICDKVRYNKEDMAPLLQAGTPVARFMAQMTAKIWTAKRVFHDEHGNITGQSVAGGGGGVGFNDVSATAYLMNPDWFETQHVTIDIDTTGLCPGQTVVDFRGMWGRAKNAHWAHDVDATALKKRFVADICAYRP